MSKQLRSCKDLNVSVLREANRGSQGILKYYQLTGCGEVSLNIV